MTARFWESKSLEQMTRAEWEALCDGCGRCCLIKLEDEDDGEIAYTSVVCNSFDEASCRCSHYEERHQRVPDCIRIGPDNLDNLDWLPGTCAYRVLNEGGALADWHPLNSGSRDSVIAAGISVQGRVQAARHVHDDELVERIIHWVEF